MLDNDSKMAKLSTIGILILFASSLSFPTVLCFGADGHIAMEAAFHGKLDIAQTENNLVLIDAGLQHGIVYHGPCRDSFSPAQVTESIIFQRSLLLNPGSFLVFLFSFQTLDQTSFRLSNRLLSFPNRSSMFLECLESVVLII